MNRTLSGAVVVAGWAPGCWWPGDEPPTTRRTLRSLPLELVTRRAGGEGRL